MNINKTSRTKQLPTKKKFTKPKLSNTIQTNQPRQN
jgi:hypothetical protein